MAKMLSPEKIEKITIFGKEYPAEAFLALPASKREARAARKLNREIDAQILRDDSNDTQGTGTVPSREAAQAALRDLAPFKCSKCTEPVTLIDDKHELCRDCYQIEIVQPLLDKRERLLAALSALDLQTGDAIKAFRPKGTQGQRRYVCRYKDCRFTSNLYLVLMQHEEEHEQASHTLRATRRNAPGTPRAARAKGISSIRRRTRELDDNI